jgi:inosose dehydratase
MTNHPTSLSRRALLVAGGCALATSLTADEKPRRIGLGFSLYGMKSLPLDRAVRACAEIGYDCVELPVLADWPADSARFTAAVRKAFAKTLADEGVRLSAVMENLPLLADNKVADNLDRLKRAAEIARDLVIDKPPPVETVLGGRPGEWEQVKEKMVERLGDWARVMADAKVVLAIKAHVGNACRTPEDLIWLLKQVDSPWIKAAYDYSHFQLQGLELAATLKTLLPQTVFIHVKDAQGEAGKFQFLLPGAGTGNREVDYPAYFRQLAAGDYRGDVVVEVSGQIHSQPGYDPLAAARQSYVPLARAFTAAGLR